MSAPPAVVFVGFVAELSKASLEGVRTRMVDHVVLQHIEAVLQGDGTDYAKLEAISEAMNSFYRAQYTGDEPEFGTPAYQRAVSGEEIFNSPTHTDGLGRKFREEDVQAAYAAGRRHRAAGQKHEATGFGDADEAGYVAYTIGYREPLGKAKGRGLDVEALVEQMNRED